MAKEKESLQGSDIAHLFIKKLIKLFIVSITVNLFEELIVFI